MHKYISNIFFIGLIIFLTYCKPAGNNVNLTEDNITLNELLVHRPNDSINSYDLKETGVLFIQMTTSECDSLERVNPQRYQAFSERINDISISAKGLLDSLGINNYWTDKRYISHKSIDKNLVIDTRLNGGVPGYCFLYKPESKPIIIKIDELEEIVKDFFN